MLRPLYKEDKNGCWIWQRGTCNGYGWYGRHYAHRVMYSWHIGGINSKIFLHHKCHNKLCVNPFHLIKTDNNNHQKHHQREQKFCKHGHPREKGNIHITKGGHWQCMTCNNNRQKIYGARRNAKRHQARLEIIEGVRKDFGRMPVKKIAEKYSIGWRSVYRYANEKYHPTKLGYF